MPKFGTSSKARLHSCHTDLQILFNQVVEEIDLEKFKDFFSTMPEVKKDLDFNCPKCGHNEQITVKGMQNFFF